MSSCEIISFMVLDLDGVIKFASGDEAKANAECDRLGRKYHRVKKEWIHVWDEDETEDE